MSDIKSEMTHVLGVDAGGSKTTAEHRSVDQLEAGATVTDKDSAVFGPGNFRQIGLQGVRELCQQIKDQFQVEVPAKVGVVAGFAGAGTPQSWQDIGAVFEEQGFSPTRLLITSDADLMVRSLGDSGVLLIAGTGSICLGRSGGTAHNDDALVRAGGYGYRVHSEASGYYLGMRAIDAALKIEDGRKQESTALYGVVLAHFGLSSLGGDIASILYPQADQRNSVQEKVAQLAPAVLAAAKGGDKVALQFVNDAVGELADHIQAVLKGMEIRSSVVGLHGGLFAAEEADELLIQPIAAHGDLKGYDLQFRTVGVKPEDPNPLLEVMRTVFC